MTPLLQILSQIPAHPLVHALGWTLLHFLWQGALVAAILWCVLGLLSGWSSQARYGAACLALGLLVALPLATFARVASVEYARRAATLNSAIVIDAGMTLQVGANAPAEPWPARLAVALDHCVPWILLAWFVGVVIFVSRLNFGLMVARRLKYAETELPSSDLLHAFDALRIRLGIARAVRLLHSARVQVPTVIGWLRPVVLMPASCLTGLSTEQIEAIFCHELAHIRRHDYLVSVFQSIVETLLFYHPGVWWVSKQVRRERECCCDAVAVAMGGDVLSYARALSYLEERRAAFPEFVLGANGGALKMRIQRLLGKKETSAASPVAVVAALCLMLALAGSYCITIVRAQSKTPPSTAANTQAAIMLASKVVASPEVGVPQSAAPQSSTGATQQTGTIAGTIVDPHGALVPHANVTAINIYTGFKAVIQSDKAGAYSTALPPGTYDLHADAPGLTTVQEMNIKVEPAKTIDLNLKMIVGMDTQSLTVAAKRQEAAPPPTPPQPPPVRCVGCTVPKPIGPQRISSGVAAGLIISQPQPVYPEQAKRQHIQGEVILHARISKEGTIKDLDVIGGPPALIVSAIDSVRQWKYKPYLIDGEPTEVDTIINVHYTLADDAGSPAQPAPENGAQPNQHSSTPPMIIYRVDPDYSEEARQLKISGTVLLNLTVNLQGVAENIHVLRGVGHGLDEKAIEAVKQYRFRPAKEDGNPVAKEINVEINFKIIDSPAPNTAATTPNPGPVVQSLAPIQSAPQLYDGAPIRKLDGSVTQPVLVHMASPEFTDEARKHKFMGIVLVNLIVDTKGQPQNVHVLRGVGMGLDEKAVTAVKQYKFKPATENGNPVPVALNVEVNFQIF